MLGTIPFKGQVLNQMAAFWFEATADLAPNHVISVPDPTVMVARECQLLPVEFVMRAYLTGVTSTSIWTHYAKGARTFCGHDLPDGMRKNQRLQKAILTPSTKAEKGDHDRSVSRAEILEMGAADAPPTSTRPAAMCARVFAFGQQEALRRGLILVDTKYEIGRRPDGDAVLHRRDPHAGFVALLVRRRLRGALRRAARSRAAWTRNTCAARWPSRATRATGRRRR